jgi:hypothetical protein
VSGYSDGTHDSSAFTPEAGRFYLIRVGIYDDNDAGSLTSVAFTGTGLTPALVNEGGVDAIAAANGYTPQLFRSVRWYYGYGSAGTSGVIRVTVSGIAHVLLHVFYVTGVDDTTPFEQVVVNEGSDAAPLVPMSAFSHADNAAVFGACLFDGAGAWATNSFAADSPLTEEAAEHHEGTYSSFACGGGFHTGNDQNPSGTLNKVMEWGAVGIELRADVEAGPPPAVGEDGLVMLPTQRW